MQYFKRGKSNCISKFFSSFISVYFVFYSPNEGPQVWRLMTKTQLEERGLTQQ